MPKYKLNRERPVSLSTVKFLGCPFGWSAEGVRGLIVVYKFVNTPEGQEAHRCWQEAAWVMSEDKFVWHRIDNTTFLTLEAVSRGEKIYLAEEIDERQP